MVSTNEFSVSRFPAKIQKIQKFIKCLFVEVEDFTWRLKESLRRNLKDCLKHDWLEEGINFPLMKYYTDLVWVRIVTEAMGRERKPMKGIHEILELQGAGEKGLNILVEGKQLYS